MFQSAPPVKGAIIEGRHVPCDSLFQSAPPVKGAMLARLTAASLGAFQSAPPVKGAMPTRLKLHDQVYVSIRAPREGGDSASSRVLRRTSSFNPRPP